MPEYGGVPPETLTVTVVESPLQRTGKALALTSNAGGCVMVMVVLATQLFESVTVNVYVPAVRPKVPIPMYGGLPPVAVTVTVEMPPLQRIGVALDAASSRGGSVM